MNILNDLAELLYPPRCIVCNQPIAEEGYCKDCKDKIEFLSEECCIGCGLPRKLCECKKYAYHFDGVTAPFKNEGFAQTAIYDFKFHDKFRCMNVFGREMAHRAVKYFGRENIDLICCMPLSRKSMLYRGFNQSKIFASVISKCLNIEFIPDLISKSDNVGTQHDVIGIDNRFANVRGAFSVNRRIMGKNVLLVDDIKTTGASLDECARQLKFAGANRVYCVTALLSLPKKKPKG